MNFTFGSDPEFMLHKDGKIFSAIEIIKFDKKKKKKISYFEFFYDNVLGECNIPASSSKEETIDTIKDCLHTFSKLIAPYELLIKSSHKYDPSQLKHKDAMKAHCNAEYCCYKMEELKTDEKVFLKTNLRSAGGHIHLGNDILKNAYNSWMTTRLMDLFLGVPSVFLDSDISSKKRKEIYGKSGRFRFTDYGIEYRSLSNFWFGSPKLVELVYDISEFVLSLIENDGWKKIWSIDEEKIAAEWNNPQSNFDPLKYHQAIYDVSNMRKAVDTCNKELAQEYMKLIQQHLPRHIFSNIQALADCKFDFKKEWGLK